MCIPSTAVGKIIGVYAEQRHTMESMIQDTCKRRPPSEVFRLRGEVTLSKQRSGIFFRGCVDLKQK